jgi:hypothetical protein
VDDETVPPIRPFEPWTILRALEALADGDARNAPAMVDHLRATRGDIRVFDPIRASCILLLERYGGAARTLLTLVLFESPCLPSVHRGC